MTISSAIAKALPAAEGVRKWRPSTGHLYQLPNKQSTASRARGNESKEDTPMPETAGKPAAVAPKTDELSLERAAEESFLAHMKHGGEYVDENPITGRPGEFHLSSTGRKAVPPPKTGAEASIGAMNGPAVSPKTEEKKEGKTPKTPKTPRSAATPKLKRKKSRMSAANTPTAT